MYEWQGCPGEDDGCHEIGPGGYGCTLSEQHRNLHEAWGTTGTDPIYVWGPIRGNLTMKWDAERDHLHIRVDSDEGMEALNRMLDEALAEAGVDVAARDYSVSASYHCPSCDGHACPDVG